MGARGKEVIHGKKKRQAELPVGRPGKILRQHLSASVSVMAQPLQAWEAAGAGEMGELQELG